MRQIGTLPTEKFAQTLSDHLKSLGMTTRVMADGNAWALWIYNEDHLTRARDELDAFLKNPDDTRYQEAKSAAAAVEREQAERDRFYRKNVRSFSGRWDRPIFRGRPLTLTLITISAVVYCFTNLIANNFALSNYLTFSPLAGGRGGASISGLEQLGHGEIWRLVTPIFLHGGPLHILFNMYWLYQLGTLIESRRGTRVLGALILVAAVGSNLAEFVYQAKFAPAPGQFGGMSGVVYALLGYVWVKGRFEPEQGMILHPSTVQIMLIWLVLCMFLTQIGTPIANIAHVSGLILGIFFGMARF